MSDIERNAGYNDGPQMVPSRDFQPSDSHEEVLRKTRTAGSLSISPELFEQLYLTPKTRVKGQLRATLGNPSPLGLLGFCIALGPVSCQLMEWRGVPGTSASQVGLWYGMGGTLMLLASVLEFIIGNTFTFVAFGTYGGWWIAQAITMTPFYKVTATYQPENPIDPEFHASFGFAVLYMAVPTFIFLICSLRTNITYVLLFLCLELGFCFLAGSYWHLAELHTALAHRLQVAAGAVFFVADILGWYVFLFLMLASVEFPFQVPLGDISHLIPARKAETKEE